MDWGEVTACGGGDGNAGARVDEVAQAGVAVARDAGVRDRKVRELGPLGARKPSPRGG